MSRQYVVIGLGRVGSSMIETMLSLGHEVMGIDCHEEIVQELADHLPEAELLTANATDENVLKSLNVSGFDGAIVLIGEDLEASILATANLKEVGVEMVAARAASKLHAKILRQIGADRVIEIERQMGRELAYEISSPSVIEYVDLGEDEALVETKVPKNWVGKSLSDLDVSRKLGLAVVAVKPEGGAGTVPHGDTVLNESDIIVVGGEKKALEKSDLLNEKD